MGVLGTGAGGAAGDAARRVQQAAGEAAREAEPWVERLARLGHVAKGVVYVVIGALAIQAAAGPGGKTTDPQGVLRTIAGQPFGKLLLGALALGLAGYALWRFVQAALDPEHRETNAKTVVKRVGYALSGLVHAGLAVTAVQLISGAAARAGANGAQDGTARLLAQPFGQWLVGLVGLVIIAVGMNALYIAWTAKFREKLKMAEMNPTEQEWATRVGRIGLAARAVVMGIIGGFLIQAALHANPREARGLDGALQVLAQQPYGKWLLGVVALGFVAYGFYMFVSARYRRIAVR
jgi:hypothetical protein